MHSRTLRMRKTIIGYDYCRISYSTHAIGGLSANDFICAAKIDRL